MKLMIIALIIGLIVVAGLFIHDFIASFHAVIHFHEKDTAHGDMPNIEYDMRNHFTHAYLRRTTNNLGSFTGEYTILCTSRAEKKKVKRMLDLYNVPYTVTH